MEKSALGTSRLKRGDVCAKQQQHPSVCQELISSRDFTVLLNPQKVINWAQILCQICPNPLASAMGVVQCRLHPWRLLYAKLQDCLSIYLWIWIYKTHTHIYKWWNKMIWRDFLNILTHQHTPLLLSNQLGLVSQLLLHLSVQVFVNHTKE